MTRWTHTFGWWCCVCGCTRLPIRYPQIGAMCPTCRSGRIAPTVFARPGERAQLPMVAA